MKPVFDRVVTRLAEGVFVLVVLSFSAVWDVLISPKLNGTPIPIILGSAILVLVFLAPKRWS